jgi:large subunit ribosomal protein L23
MALFRRKKKEQPKDKKPVEKTVDVKADKKESKPSEKKETTGKVQPGKERKNRFAHKILIHPLITEKSNIQASFNQYVFLVASSANKVEIKKAVEEIYHVKPIQVRIINVLGKMVRTGRRGHLSCQKNWKKAIVTIPADKKIDVYEGI